MWNVVKDKLQESKEAEDEDENTLDDISGDEVSHSSSGNCDIFNTISS